MKENNIIIRPVTNILIISSHGLIISIKETPISLGIRELMAAPFTILIKGARKCQKPVTIFKVLLKDIIKALYQKIIREPAEIQKLLLIQYYDYLPLFEGDMVAELPLHRPGMNYIFILENNKIG